MITDELKKEKACLEKELSGIEPKRRRLALINELLRSYNEVPDQRDLIQVAPSFPQKFSELGVSDAIVLFLKQRPHEYFTVREIADGIVEGGFKPPANNFHTIVNTTCSRKSQSKKPELDAAEKNGVKAYRFKQ
jgi:hypothetical protein